MSREAFEAWYDKNHWSMLLTPKEDVASIWQAAQADAFERAAKVCDARARKARTQAAIDRAQDDAAAIRALAKEAT